MRNKAKWHRAQKKTEAERKRVEAQGIVDYQRIISTWLNSHETKTNWTQLNT
jgi:hypothetical protein